MKTALEIEVIQILYISILEFQMSCRSKCRWD